MCICFVGDGRAQNDWIVCFTMNRHCLAEQPDLGALTRLALASPSMRFLPCLMFRASCPMMSTGRVQADTYVQKSNASLPPNATERKFMANLKYNLNRCTGVFGIIFLMIFFLAEIKHQFPQIFKNIKFI